MKQERNKIQIRDDLKIVFEKTVNLRDKYIALGFHGLGGIGHLTTRFLVESAVEQGIGERVGYVIGRIIPPFVEVLEDGKIGFPYELYMVENVLFLFIRIQPWLDDQPILADIFTKLAADNGVKSFVLFGGVDVNVFPEDRKELPIVFVGNDIFIKNVNEILPNFEIEAAPKGILVSGGISLFLEFSTYRNLPAVALFSPTSKGILDKKGAYNLAQKFIELTGLPISLKRIKKEIEMTQMLLKQIQETPPIEMPEKKGEDEEPSHVFT